jgi:hypothetical protein
VALESKLVGGLEHGRWWFFSDPNNQAHVTGRFEADLYSGLRTSAILFRLQKNHRNTRPIVESVRQLLQADLGAPRIGAGPAVQFPKIESEAKVLEYLEAHVRKLVEDGVSLSDIHFVSLASNIEESVVFKMELSKRGKIGREVRNGFATLWTPGMIKGLEGDHVMVVDVSDLTGPVELANLYVAMTRARISLWVGLDPAARLALDAKVNAQIIEEREAKGKNHENR